jgi:RTX calcium-binding nonapeptide repeat (4 copies)
MRVLLAAFAALLLAAAPARAATLTVSAGTLDYSAADGRRNVVAFDQLGPNTVRVTRQLTAGGDEDAITSVSGCDPLTPNVSYSCAGVTRVVANGGDGDDRLDAGSLLSDGQLTTIPATLRGGPGKDVLAAGDSADVLEGGDGDDTLTGGDGDSALRGDAGDDVVFGGIGNEIIEGGAGNDTLQGNRGRDSLRGGDGADGVLYADTAGAVVTVTLDGVADDGSPGEGDDAGADVENVTASSARPDGTPGAVVVTGNDASNALQVDAGAATIVGAGGPDVLTGGIHNDLIDARDGVVDRIACRDGADIVLADAADDVAADCEDVRREAAPAPPPAPTPTPAPKRKPAVRSFKPHFITRAALAAGSELGRLEEIDRVGGLKARSKVTLRCVKACSRKVRVTRTANRKGRVRLVVRGGLIARKATRIELRVSRSGERTRWVRYRFVRVVDRKRGLILTARRAGSGVAAR